jgi:hypothetical protein
VTVQNARASRSSSSALPAAPCTCSRRGTLRGTLRGAVKGVLRGALYRVNLRGYSNGWQRGATSAQAARGRRLRGNKTASQQARNKQTNKANKRSEANKQTKQQTGEHERTRPDQHGTWRRRTALTQCGTHTVGVLTGVLRGTRSARRLSCITRARRRAQRCE